MRLNGDRPSGQARRTYICLIWITRSQHSRRAALIATVAERPVASLLVPLFLASWTPLRENDHMLAAVRQYTIKSEQGNTGWTLRRRTRRFERRPRMHAQATSGLDVRGTR